MRHPAIRDWSIEAHNWAISIEILQSWNNWSELHQQCARRAGNECVLSKVVQLDIALQLLTQAQAFLRCVFTLFRPHLTSALLLSSEATLRGR